MPKKATEVYEYIDDMDGGLLPPDTTPLKYKIQNKTYNLYLSKKNEEKFLTFINDVIKGAEVVGSTSNSGGGTATKVDTYGYDFNDVRDWAVKNNKQTTAGQPIKATTRRLHQGIYNDYKAAQPK